MTRSELPNGWARAKLGDILTVNPRDDLSAIPNDALVSFVPMQNVAERSGKLDASRHRPIAEVRRGYTQFRDGDLLVAKITPCMENGKFAIAERLSNGVGFGSTEFHVLRCPPGISNRYVFYYVIQQGFRNSAAHNMKGTAGQKRVPTAWLEQVQLPIAPAAEQERIVAAIDALFTRLEAAEACLDRVEILSTRFRQSYLTTGISGGLTREWRQGRRLAPCLKATIGDRFEVYVGSTPKRSVPEYWNGNIAWVSSGEIRFRRITETREKLTQRGVTEARLKIHPPGTVLMAMIGEGKTRGQAAILDIEACHNQNSAAISVKGTGVLPEFLYYSLCAKYEANRRISSGGNQPALSGRRVRSIPFDCPPEAEMDEIVSRLVALDASSEGVSAALASLRSSISGLRQSILATAFSGKLVPRDPNEEAAEELLERIRFRRGADTTQPKRTRRKPKKAAA